jgi:restriction endonuclease S subunit
MPSVDGLKGIIANPEQRPFAEVKKGYTYFAEEDVLFAKITPCMQNGKHAIARNLIDGIGFGSTEFHVIRPSPVIAPEWIHFLVRQPNVLQDATAHFTGAVGQQRVPDSFLLSLEIPLPPLAEQRCIAAVLNEQMVAVEKARAAAEAQLEAAESLPATYLRQVFPQSGEELPPGWRWVRLGDIADVVNGVGFPEHLQGRKGLPYLFVKVSDMNAVGAEKTISEAINTVDDGLLRQLGGRVYPPGTVVFPKVGGALLTNKKRILGKSGCFDNNVMGLVPNGIEGDFLFYWFRTVDLRDISNTQALPSVRQSVVADLELPFPPLSEQKRIAAIMNEQMVAVGKVQTALEEQLSEINTLPAVLLRQAFAGEI